MRRELILVVAAATFGLAGGYGWSVMTAPPPKAPRHAKAGFMPLPSSPEEQPSVLDRDWAADADDSGPAGAPATATANVHYSGCNEVRAAGKAPLTIDDPGYSPTMDGDGDGIACEPVRAH